MTEQSTVDPPAHLCNEAAVREVVRHIEIMPSRWDQANWANPDNECGTTFCVAGWAARIFGYVDGDGQATKKGVDFFLNSFEPPCGCGEDDCDASSLRRQERVRSDLESPGVVSYPSFWTKVGKHELGLSSHEARYVFGGCFASTVPELKRNLTICLGITFDEGADPHVP